MSPCERTWEVEAARDGRLSRASMDHLAEHVASCDACGEEADALDHLAKALRAVPAPADPVAIDRLRDRVVARAAAQQPSRALRALAVIAAAGVVVLAIGMFARRSPPRAVDSHVDAVANDGTRWTHRIEGETERVELSDGTLRLSVHHGANEKRLVVHVPDGEIEDVGTVFEVVVAGGKTERVAVNEGRVIVRLDGAAPITLDGGASWQRSHAVAATTPSTLRSAVPPAPKPAHKATPPPPPPSATTDPAAGEDESYLKTLRLLRAGRRDEAKAEARDYLRRYPDGFRRDEMERIAR